MIVNIDNDLVQIRDTWNKLSFASRAITSISLLISFMSIASVASNIIELRGFIVAGIDFYRSIAKAFFAFIHIPIPPEFRDFVVFNLFIIIPIYKGEAVTRPAAEFSWTRITQVYFFIVILPVISLFLFKGEMETVHRLGTSAVLLWFIYKFLSDTDRRRILLKAVFHILIVTVLLCIVAAISIGLSGPLEK